MAVPNTFVNSQVADADEVNENFTYVGMVPVGTILPWAKTLTGVPALDDHFVECNGQTLSDAESLLNGQVIPDLNGDARFLYGAATSGGTKTEDYLPNHSHGVPAANSTVRALGTDNSYVGNIGTTAATKGTAWEGYAVVYIMRIK